MQLIIVTKRLVPGAVMKYTALPSVAVRRFMYLATHNAYLLYCSFTFKSRLIEYLGISFE